MAKAKQPAAPKKAPKPKAKPKPKGKSKAGRPTVYTPEVLAKLAEAHMWGATQGEAAEYAGVSPTGYCEWLKTHPEFSERIPHLKGMTRLHAKRVVFNAVKDGDLAQAWEVLERGKELGYEKPQEQPRAGTGGVQVNVLAPGQTPEGQAAINVLHSILTGGRIPIAGHQGEGE